MRLIDADALQVKVEKIKLSLTNKRIIQLLIDNEPTIIIDEERKELQMIKSCLGCIYQEYKITSEPCNSCIYGDQSDLRNKQNNYEPDEETAYRQKWGS